ncbi:hypothetical protein LUZ60_013696 [Juncus effusus]|nr:hypothetical protein LUZ60_013696 [Juncus effusus]
MRALHSISPLHTNPNPNPNPNPKLTSSNHTSTLRIRTSHGVRIITRSQKNADKSSHISKRNEKEEEESGNVRCDLQVISWRERGVDASISVNADVDSVWSVLTDYERLANFIPNLVYSGRIPCPHEGRIWLEQRGLQRALYWHIEARVVLDLHEIPNSANGRELHFSMVDGDFKKFEGKWSIQAGKSAGTAKLSYQVNVTPRFNFPAIFLERIIRSDLPTNLKALAFQAEQKYHKVKVNSTDLEASVVSDHLKEDLSSVDKLAGTDLKADDKMSGKQWGVYGNSCRVDGPGCVVDEIHFRRFDGLLENGGAHRCVFASITVKASVTEVWNLLTAYEQLPEIVPNLAISKILFRDNNKVRILQEGCKGLLYMVLHARVVLDLTELMWREISFEQVEGDFDSFQGRWKLEKLGESHTLLKYMVETKIHQDNFLSEAILEEVIYEDLPSNLCAIRDYIESSHLPNTRSTTHQPPSSPSQNTGSTTDQTPTDSQTLLSQPLSSQISLFQPSIKNTSRPKVPNLQTDLEVLKSEISGFVAKYGQNGFMPMRKQLRLYGRVDIEKAITKMGGFRKVAGLMGLSLAYKDRKPKGYWDQLDNLNLEIKRFQRNWGMDPDYMPSRKSFERAGRYDIARALEKWGGLVEVSRLLSLQLRRPRKISSSDSEDEQQPTDSKSEKKNNNNSLTGRVKILNESNESEDAKRWFMKFEDLNTNWVDY